MVLGLSNKKVLSLFSFSIFCILILPRLMSYGVFFDGVIYGMISKNLAEGLGTAWSPYFNQLNPTFFEHPPLVFWVQSIFFKVFGDSRFIDVFYSFFTGLVTLFLMKSIWKRTTTLNVGSWFVVILFSVIPMISWIYANNMLENTLTVLTLLTVLSIIFTLKVSNSFFLILGGVFSGIFLIASFLAKGPTGLFPLATPFLFVVVYRSNLKKSFLIYIGILIALLIFLLYLWYTPEAAKSLKQYLGQQVFASLSGKRKNSSHFYVFGKLLAELGIPIIFSLFLYLTKRKKGKLTITKEFWLFFLIALSASAPIALSSKQMMWYLLPSLPFYCLALAALFRPFAFVVETSLTYRKSAYLLGTSIVIFLIAILSMFLDRNTVRKDFHYNQDFSVQQLEMEKDELVTVCPKTLVTHFAIQASFMRFHRASITTEGNHKYLLVKSGSRCTIPASYKKFHPPKSVNFTLYKKGS